MKLPKMGHAVIINNIASEMPGSNEDVEALKESYKTVGFEDHFHENCTVQVQILKAEINKRYIWFGNVLKLQILKDWVQNAPV